MKDKGPIRKQGQRRNQNSASRLRAAGKNPESPCAKDLEKYAQLYNIHFPVHSLSVHGSLD